MSQSFVLGFAQRKEYVQAEELFGRIMQGPRAAEARQCAQYYVQRGEVQTLAPISA